MGIYGNTLKNPIEFFDLNHHYIFESQYITEAVIDKNKLKEAIEFLRKLLRDLLEKIKRFMKERLKDVSDSYYREVNKNKPKVKGYYEFYHKYFKDVNDLFRLDTDYLDKIDNDNVKEYADKIETLFVNRIEKRFNTTSLSEIQDKHDEFVKEEKYVLNYRKETIKTQTEKITTLLHSLSDDINTLSGLLQGQDIEDENKVYIQKIIFRYTHLIQFGNFGMNILSKATNEYDRVMKEYKEIKYAEDLKENNLKKKTTTASFMEAVNKKDVDEVRSQLIFMLKKYVEYPKHKSILAKFNASLAYALKYKIDLYEKHDESIAYIKDANTTDSLIKNIENLKNNFSKERLDYILEEIKNN